MLIGSKTDLLDHLAYAYDQYLTGLLDLTEFVAIKNEVVEAIGKVEK